MPKSRPPARQRPAAPIVIGLAGGIGAGKSTAASAFAALGCHVLDSDAGAKAALRRPEVKDALVGWWGTRILDPRGEVDSRAVAAIVFEFPHERQRLEALVHPIVVRDHERAIAEAANRGVACVVIDSPLLFEAGLNARCDAVVFIDAPREERLRRVARTRGWTPEELARRENSQMPLEIKRRSSDHVVVNDGDEGLLSARIRDVFEAIKSRRSSAAGTRLR